MVSAFRNVGSLLPPPPPPSSSSSSSSSLSAASLSYMNHHFTTLPVTMQPDISTKSINLHPPSYIQSQHNSQIPVLPSPPSIVSVQPVIAEKRHQQVNIDQDARADHINNPVPESLAPKAIENNTGPKNSSLPLSSSSSSPFVESKQHGARSNRSNDDANALLPVSSMPHTMDDEAENAPLSLLFSLSPSSSSPPSSSEKRSHIPASSGGRPASKATQLRKSIVDPWRAHYDVLKAKASDTTSNNNKQQKYMPEDYVVQTVKHYHSSDTVDEKHASTLAKLRKLFQIATPIPSKPSPEHCEWINTFKDYFIRATAELTTPESATSAERDMCAVSLLTSSITTPTSSRKNKRLVDQPGEDDHEDDPFPVQKKTRRHTIATDDHHRSETVPVSVTTAELDSVTDGLYQKYNEIAQSTSSFSKPQFWRKIGVELKDDADSQRASRLLRKEYQPNVMKFYRKYKDVIQAFLRNTDIDRTTSLPSLSNSSSSSTSSLSLSQPPLDSQDDPAMTKIQTFLSCLKATQAEIRLVQSNIENDRTQLEQIKERIIQQQQHLDELQSRELQQQTKWTKIQSAVMIELD